MDEGRDGGLKGFFCVGELVEEVRCFEKHVSLRPAESPLNLLDVRNPSASAPSRLQAGKDDYARATGWRVLLLTFCTPMRLARLGDLDSFSFWSFLTFWADFLRPKIWLARLSFFLRARSVIC